MSAKRSNVCTGSPSRRSVAVGSGTSGVSEISTTSSPSPTAACLPTSSLDRLQLPAGVQAPHVQLRRLLGAREDDDVAGRRDRVDLQADRGRGLAVDQQPSRVVPVARGEQTPAGQPRWRAGRDVRPDVVVVLPHDLGTAGVGVDRQHLHVALVAGLHEHERGAFLGPRDRHDVLERFAVPHDVDPRSVQPQDVQGHERIRRARLGVAHRPRRRRRVDRRGDVPDLERPVVHPRGEQPVPVGRPPIPAATLHLLGRDELGDAPMDVGVFVVGEPSIGPGRQVDRVQRAAGDIGHLPPRGVGPSVERRTRGRELTDPTLDEIRDEQTIADDERCDRERRIRRVRHDARSDSRASAPGDHAPRR